MEKCEAAVEQVRKSKNYGMVVPINQGKEPVMYENLGIEGIPQEILQGYENNDAGNARRFLDVYGEDVRYCAVEKQWYVCQGDMSWNVDEELLVNKLAYNSVYNSYVHEIQFYTAIDKFGQMKNTIAKLERGLHNIGNFSTLKNCIGMAQKEVPITIDCFDNHNHLFHDYTYSKLNLWDLIIKYKIYFYYRLLIFYIRQLLKEMIISTLE